MGHPFKCFLDAYKGYHQVQMSEEDEENTAFYIDQGTYCYVKMPFGLKNAGATYQRLVDSPFQAQLGRNLEAYVDDMVIKSKTEHDMIMDIAETFDNLQKINMKLNPMKCSFGLAEGKFLGYMVTSKGIRANPKKTKAIADMQSPKTLKEMQSLSGKLAALNRFLSRSAERSLPFFETLKNITKENKDECKWTEEAELAFHELKRLILELPILTTPEKKEALYVYLAASREAVRDVEEVSAIVEGERHNWMTPIIECLEKGIWPNDENKVGSLRIKISQYVMEDGVLFKKSYLSPLLRCVGPLQANYIIREVHEGASGMDARARSVVAKIVRQGYYWPSMHGDTKEVIDKCDSCQIHAPVPKLPKTRLTSIMFGLPRVIVTDNGTQLVNDPFKSWCEKWKIKQMNIAVAHPQANGLVERANKSLMHGLKARLRRERLGWVDELPNILWAHRTMMKTSNGETPFSLTYGSEAVISAEIGMPTYRTIHFNEA
ncbi:reverse transcriptase domain-containing protein [Tanacetum coccineum]